MKKNVTSPTDKSLIADQPGMVVALTGLVIAVFFGLAIRAFLAPDRIKTLVEAAAEKMHKDVDVQIDRAYFSLADGSLPQFAVVVKGIKLESKHPCWFSPLTEINELRLPLSFRSLLRGELNVSQIEADYVNLIFRSGAEECRQFRSTNQDSQAGSSRDDLSDTPEMVTGNGASLDSTAGKEDSLAKSQEPSAKQELQKKIPAKQLAIIKKSLNPIVDKLIINKLRVSYLPASYASAEILDFNVRLKSLEPKLVVIRGKVNLGGESVVGDYVSHSTFYLEYSEAVAPSWKGEVIGNLREGHFEFNSEYKVDDGHLKLEMLVKHLPLNHVAPSLEKYGLLKSDINGKEVWLSFTGSTEGTIKEPKKLPLRLRNVRLEGDIGEIEAPSIELQSFEPLVYKPIEFNLKQVNFTNFLRFLNRPHPSKALGQLGLFSGQATLHSSEQMVLKGEHQGLEFIFANRGQRELQTISLITGQIALQNGEWNVVVDKLRPQEGSFSGDIRLKADRNFKNTRINLNIDELTFSNKVQYLMTRGGEIGAIRGDAEVRFVAGEMEDVKGDLRMDKFLVEGLLFEKFRAKFETQGGVVDMRVSLNKIGLGIKTAAYKMLRELFLAFSPKDDMIELKTVETKLKTRMLRDFYWDDFTAQVGKAKLSMNGGWDSQELLSGHISLSAPKGRWFIRGQRERPELLYDDSLQKAKGK